MEDDDPESRILVNSQIRGAAGQVESSGFLQMPENNENILENPSSIESHESP